MIKTLKIITAKEVFSLPQPATKLKKGNKYLNQL